MEANSILHYRYEIEAKDTLNSATMRTRYVGALINLGGGYACIHPWPEFGDAPLDVHLASLLTDQPTALAQAAIECAIEDLSARKKGVSLFEGLRVPQSHYSWDSSGDLDEQCRLLIDEKWCALKLKGVREFSQTAKTINSIVCRLSATNHRTAVRVDFNSCLDTPALENFLNELSSEAREWLDFIEDPVPYESRTWKKIQEKYRVKLALDKGWRDGDGGFDFLIIKPTRRDWQVVAEAQPDCPVVITSAMDHALGQSRAALLAARAAAYLGDRVGICGLCTQHLFPADAFSRRLSSPGGIFHPDTFGGGLGFGDLLEKLEWKSL